MPPFFTIITATYNAAATLPRLLESLAAQTCRDFIWVAQDGASTDNTLAVIDAWRDRLPAVSVESTPDTGIYDAWNKALERQGDNLGQWVLFLGADDLLVDSEVLSKVQAALQQQCSNIRFANGTVILFEEDGSSSRVLRVDIPYSFARRYFMRMPFAHPSLFTAREVFAKNRFIPTFRIAGDYDWALRVWTQENEATALDIEVTRMSQGGISNNPQHHALMHREMYTILRTHARWALKITPLYYYLLLESYFFSYKMQLRAWFSRSYSGQMCWNILHRIRKSIFNP